MKLKLSYEGSTETVTTERKARAWARKQLGVARVKETPTANGWQLWAATDSDEMSDDCVTVVVL